MRIVHTADWHVGRVWKSRTRLDETAKVLDSLAAYLERERVDLLLVAGDLFDSCNPGADAEALVFGLFRRLSAAKIPAVAIAGNHDSPGRLDACDSLAELAGVRLLGRPRSASKGGVVDIVTPRGERARVAALPFATPGLFVSALELAEDETRGRAAYAERFKQAAAHLAQGFRPDCVNLFLAHTHLDGAVLANSERQVHLGEEWAATPQSLPDRAHYVALGHIHRPQRVESAPAPTEYAGSPLQLDFGEAGQAKSFVVLDAAPGMPVRIEHVPYEGGLPLVDLRLSLAELEAREAELRGTGWLRIVVPLEEPDLELSRKVRDRLPNAVIVKAEMPEHAIALAAAREDKGPVDMYRDYHVREHGRLPDDGIQEAFGTLYARCGD